MAPADDNTVQRNVISGNNYGISINSGSGNYIYGNFIGPDASGNSLIGPPPPNPSQYYGVHIQNISAQNNHIGGPAPGQGNVISGNREGIWMTGNCSNNFVQGNLIGVGEDGNHRSRKHERRSCALRWGFVKPNWRAWN